MLTTAYTSLLLELPWPVSLWSYFRPLPMGGWAKIVRTRAGRIYRDEVSAAVKRVLRTMPLEPIFTTPVRMDLELRAPDSRQRDIDNTLKSLQDSLMHAGVLKDDSLIHELTARWGKQKHPGCAICIITALDQPALT